MSIPTNETPSTLLDLFIVAAVILYTKIYAAILFIVSHEFIRSVLIDIQQLSGAIVGVLGVYLILLRINKVRKQNKEFTDKKQ